MNTDELIKRLSSDVSPISPRALEKHILLGVADGVFASATIVILWLGLRPDLETAATSSAFLLKASYTAVLAVCAVAASVHLMRPDARPAIWFALPVIPFAALGVLAISELAGAPREAWDSLAFGQSVSACIVRISVISVPVFLGLLLAARRLAPTRLRAAGAAMGLASGSFGAALYSLHCIESSASFIFLWYSLAIAIAAALGALIAPLVLRW